MATAGWMLIEMRIVTNAITREELRELSARYFGNLVKVVVDVGREVIAVDADMHSDLEAFLLKDGSQQSDLWGINLYPEEQPSDFVEFDSMINVRPSQNNRSRSVNDENTRIRIIRIVEKLVKP